MLIIFWLYDTETGDDDTEPGEDIAPEDVTEPEDETEPEEETEPEGKQNLNTYNTASGLIMQNDFCLSKHFEIVKFVKSV